MSMDTEESLKEYLQAPAEDPAARPDRPAGPDASTSSPPPRPGVKEILTVGKLAWEVRSATTTSSWSTPRPPATWSASSPRPEAINELVKVGLVRDQTDWMIDMLSDPAIDRRGDRGHARGDAGHRDPRAGRAARRPRPTSTSPRSSSTGCCPSCSPAARRRSSTGSAPSPTRSLALGGGAGAGVGPVLEGAELAVTPAPHPGRAPRPGCATELARGAPAALRALPVHPGPRRPGHPQAGRGPRRGARVLMAGPRPRRPTTTETRSSSSAPPRRS